MHFRLRKVCKDTSERLSGGLTVIYMNIGTMIMMTVTSFFLGMLFEVYLRG